MLSARLERQRPTPPCLQSRMNHRCETRIVIRRNVGNRARLLGLGIQIRIGAAHKPEHGWNVPARSEGPKVLARGCWLRLLNTLSREVTSKCICDTLCGIWIILHKRVTVEWSDLRFFRRS